MKIVSLMSGNPRAHFRKTNMKKIMTEWRNFTKIHKVNEKIYKKYASRLSEESQEVFWNLSEDQKVFVVEDWVKQGRPAQHLNEDKMADLNADQAYSA
jgi:translation initiation factor 2 alpha subunit (eIF-2alpha)